MSIKIDLHAHTTHSDGTESVAEVFEKALEAGVTTLAITDHDTTAGWAEAERQAAKTGIQFVPGIEVTTYSVKPGETRETGSFSVHMLAYLPDPNNTQLRETLAASVESREVRMREMVERISKDYHVTYEQVMEGLAEGATIGRPALADALVRNGHFLKRGEVFERIWYKGNPYWVPNLGVPETADAIRLIREAGGVPIMAHPIARKRTPSHNQPMPRAEFLRLIEAGLAGFETKHRDVKTRARYWLTELALEHDLIVTGSSDYHGETGKPNRLGEKTTSPEMFERILAQASGSKPIG